MDILKQIQVCAQTYPERIAVRNGADVLTYKELWEQSERLACWIVKTEGDRRDPIAVYGHKNPWMLVSFLACVKSGRGYCPIDCSVPEARVEMILQALSSGIVLTTETMTADAKEKQVLGLTELKVAVAEQNETASRQESECGKCSTGEPGQKNQKHDAGSWETDPAQWVHGDETYYIIFTSGSTGTPKGVQISADCLNHYLDWSVGLGSSAKEKEGQVFLNQAPFSFDLSVMDLYTCLASGGTLYCLEKSVQSDYKSLMEALRESGANVWVSTPSFAEVCLSERSYNEEMMPELEVFLFCGETLANRTVKKLQDRFPKARILNTYGPTESTVAVTDVLVTREMNEAVDPLPVGRAKPGTRIEIWDENGNVLPDGEKGEIIILGNTVSTGYYQRADLTEKAFFSIDRVRGYHTGDKGYLENGMLFYCGRIDLQIKLHGYRIELEDIENNIRRLPGIEHAVVLPNMRDGKVKSLTAYVVENQMPEDEKSETAALKQGLLQYVPEYMVPKKFVYLEQMPMTNNGKADRKKLGGTA